MKVRTRKRKPVYNRRANPLRSDPTRTLLLRQALATELRKRFARLKLKLHTLVVTEDAFGLVERKPPTFNAFCPTGEGGGVDPTCSPGEVSSETVDTDTAGVRFYENVDPEFLPWSGNASVPSDWRQLTSDPGELDSVVVRDVRDIRASEESSRAAIDAMKDYIRNPENDLPPIIVEYDGKGFYVLDGNTRFLAAKELGYKRIPVREHFQDGLTSNKRRRLTANENWRFQSDPDKIKAFKEWLATQIEADVLEEDLWQRYAMEGFRKGAGRAFDDVASRRFGPKAGEFYEGSRREFLRSAFGRPVAVEKVKLLAGRAFDDLEGVTQAMSTKMVRSLTDGLVRGQSPREIARQMAKDVDGIGQRRALLISHDAIIRTHAEGQLTALEELGVEEVGVSVEWSTSGMGATALGNPSPCDLCAPLQGVVLKLAEARGMLPRHPN